jgi:hypothetical protein
MLIIQTLTAIRSNVDISFRFRWYVYADDSPHAHTHAHARAHCRDPIYACIARDFSTVFHDAWMT